MDDFLYLPIREEDLQTRNFTPRVRGGDLSEEALRRLQLVTRVYVINFPVDAFEAHYEGFRDLRKSDVNHARILLSSFLGHLMNVEPELCCKRQKEGPPSGKRKLDAPDRLAKRTKLFEESDDEDEDEGEEEGADRDSISSASVGSADMILGGEDEDPRGGEPPTAADLVARELKLEPRVDPNSCNSFFFDGLEVERTGTYLHQLCSEDDEVLGYRLYFAIFDPRFSLEHGILNYVEDRRKIRAKEKLRVQAKPKTAPVGARVFAADPNLEAAEVTHEDLFKAGDVFSYIQIMNQEKDISQGSLFFSKSLRGPSSDEMVQSHSLNELLGRHNFDRGFPEEVLDDRVFDMDRFLLRLEEGESAPFLPPPMRGVPPQMGPAVALPPYAMYPSSLRHWRFPQLGIVSHDMRGRVDARGVFQSERVRLEHQNKLFMVARSGVRDVFNFGPRDDLKILANRIQPKYDELFVRKQTPVDAALKDLHLQRAILMRDGHYKVKGHPAWEDWRRRKRNVDSRRARLRRLQSAAKSEWAEEYNNRMTLKSSISPFLRALVEDEDRLQTADPDFSLYGPQEDSGDPTLSALGNDQVNFLLKAEDGFHASSSHSVMYLLWIGIHDKYRFAFDLHFNPCLTGKTGCGKSFAVKSIVDMQIEGTHQTITGQTEAAMDVDGNLNHGSLYYDELPKRFLRDRNNPKDMGDEKLKMLLTLQVTNKLTSEFNTTGTRYNRAVSCEHIGVMIVSSNPSFDEMPGPIQDRLFHIPFVTSVRDGNNISDMATKVNDELICRPLAHDSRLFQHFVARLSGCIRFKAVQWNDEVNLLVPILALQRLKSLLIRENPSVTEPFHGRMVTTYTNICRVLTYRSAYLRLREGTVVGGRPQGGLERIRDVRRCEPLLLAGPDVAVIGLSLMRDHIVDPVRRVVLMAVSKAVGFDYHAAPVGEDDALSDNIEDPDNYVMLSSKLSKTSKIRYRNSVEEIYADITKRISSCSRSQVASFLGGMEGCWYHRDDPSSFGGGRDLPIAGETEKGHLAISKHYIRESILRSDESYVEKLIACVQGMVAEDARYATNLTYKDGYQGDLSACLPHVARVIDVPACPEKQASWLPSNVAGYATLMDYARSVHAEFFTRGEDDFEPDDEAEPTRPWHPPRYFPHGEVAHREAHPPSAGIMVYPDEVFEDEEEEEEEKEAEKEDAEYGDIPSFSSSDEDDDDDPLFGGGQ